jgi:hypothetical protein
VKAHPAAVMAAARQTPDSSDAAETNVLLNPAAAEPPASAQADPPADVHLDFRGLAAPKVLEPPERSLAAAQSAHPALDPPVERSVVVPAPARLEC